MTQIHLTFTSKKDKFKHWKRILFISSGHLPWTLKLPALQRHQGNRKPTGNGWTDCVSGCVIYVHMLSMFMFKKQIPDCHARPVIELNHYLIYQDLVFSSVLCSTGEYFWKTEQPAQSWYKQSGTGQSHDLLGFGKDYHLHTDKIWVKPILMGAKNMFRFADSGWAWSFVVANPSWIFGEYLAFPVPFPLILHLVRKLLMLLFER